MNHSKCKSKASCEFDGREIELLLKAIETQMNESIPDFKRREFDILADKLLSVKRDFHQENYNRFAVRYNLTPKILT